MLRKWIKSGLLLALTLLSQVPSARSQMTIGGTTLTGGANVSFGFSASSGAGSSANNINLGFSGDLRGYYWNPAFLEFSVTPYYNQSRLNSTFNSISGAKGFDTTLGLFRGSNMPLNINFSKDYNRESQYGIPGSTTGFISEGNSQNFNLNWAYHPENLPSLNVAWGTGSGSSKLVGTDSRGSGSSRVFSIGSAYTVWGFALNGSFTKTHTTQSQALITDVTKNLEQSSDQSNQQFGVTRALNRWASVSGNLSRSSFTANLSGNPTSQTFKSMSTSVAMAPTSKLNVTVNSSYTTSLSAMFLQSLLPGTPGSGGAPAPPLTLFPTGIPGTGTTSSSGDASTIATLSGISSDYLLFGANAGYRISKDLRVNGNVQRTSQTFSGGQTAKSMSETGSVSYGRKLFGGQFSAHGSLMKFSFDSQVQSSSVAYSVGGGYTHDWGHWHNSVDLQYSKSNTQTLTTTLVDGYGVGVNTGRRFGKYRLNLNGRMGQNSLAGFADTKSTTNSFSASLGAGRYGFSGSYSRNSGSSLQTAGGLVPITIPGEVLLPDLLVLYKGSAYSFAGTYNPTRRLKLTGDYTHSQYETSSKGAVSENMMTQMRVRTEYQFRLLSVSAGFSRITQALGITTGAKIPTVNSYYIGISRHFDLF